MIQRKAVRIADFAYKDVDLSKPDTCKGIAVGLDSVATLLCDVASVVEAYTKALDRKQEITPVGLRLALAKLRLTSSATITAWCPGIEEGGGQQ